MRTIYLDIDHKCHVTDTGGLKAVETEVFDDKCDFYVEGFRFIPDGEVWVRDDGVTFEGEMASPWKDYATLEATQAQYEEDLAKMADMEKSLAILGVKV